MEAARYNQNPKNKARFRRVNPTYFLTSSTPHSRTETLSRIPRQLIWPGPFHFTMADCGPKNHNTTEGGWLSSRHLLEPTKNPSKPTLSTSNT